MEWDYTAWDATLCWVAFTLSLAEKQLRCENKHSLCVWTANWAIFFFFPQKELITFCANSDINVNYKVVATGKFISNFLWSLIFSCLVWDLAKGMKHESLWVTGAGSQPLSLSGYTRSQCSRFCRSHPRTLFLHETHRTPAQGKPWRKSQIIAGPSSNCNLHLHFEKYFVFVQSRRWDTHIIYSIPLGKLRKAQRNTSR